MPFRGRWVAVLVPLALLTAACGDDGSGDSDDADGVEGEAPEEAGFAEGEPAVTEEAVAEVEAVLAEYDELIGALYLDPALLEESEELTALEGSFTPESDFTD